MTSLLKTLLELDGFEVMSVTHGKDAISKANAFQPDAFIIDFHLHDMEGVELVTQLRNSPTYAATFVIMASGMEKSDEALASGANRFLLKPYDPDTLSNLLKASI
jgi:DNA-binding response OmpR family regulator